MSGDIVIDRNRTWMIVAALAALTVAAVFPLSAAAQTQCSNPAEGDADGDGFDDAAECGGIQLSQGLEFLDVNGQPTTFVPSCDGSNLPRAFCLDFASPDLFAIIVRADPSGLPAELLSFTAADEAEGGLGVAVHLLSASDPTGSRVVSSISPQNAVRITESLSDPGDTLGLANYGSPNGLDGSTIWTTRIQNFVADKCGPTGDLCETDNGASGQADVTEALAQWVLNHEVGHLFALTADYNSRFGGFHLKAGEDEVMTQFVKYNTNKKTDITTFFIPSTYSDRSRADKLLQ